MPDMKKSQSHRKFRVGEIGPKPKELSAKTWEVLAQPVPQVIEQIEEAAKQTPERIEVTVVLEGMSAAQFHFVAALLKAARGMTDAEIAAYLLRSGCEREMERLATAYNQGRQK